MLTIHADDYGYNEAVSGAISDLARKNCISSLSVMTTTEWSRMHLDNIKSHLSCFTGSVGVHVCLTEAPAATEMMRNICFDGLTLPRYADFLKMENDGRFSEDVLYNEIKAQIELLSKYIEVDFIDFHHGLHMKSKVVAKVLVRIAKDQNINFIRGGKVMFFRSRGFRKAHEIYYNMKIQSCYKLLSSTLRMNDIMIVDPGRDSVLDVLQDKLFLRECAISNISYVLVVHPSGSSNIKSNRLKGRVDEYHYLKDKSNKELSKLLKRLC